MPTLVKRKEIMLYLNTKPSEVTPEWGLYGKKSTSATYTYNPNSTSETYITDEAKKISEEYNISINKAAYIESILKEKPELKIEYYKEGKQFLKKKIVL